MQIIQIKMQIIDSKNFKNREFQINLKSSNCNYNKKQNYIINKKLN